MTVGVALEFFSSLNLAGWRGEVAAKIVKDVSQRLRFLVDVGLDYLTLDRSAETPSRGEAQPIQPRSPRGSALLCHPAGSPRCGPPPGSPGPHPPGTASLSQQP